MRTATQKNGGDVRSHSLLLAAVRLCSLLSGRPVQVGLDKGDWVPLQRICNGHTAPIPGFSLTKTRRMPYLNLCSLEMS